jgi:hypothetical protein
VLVLYIKGENEAQLDILANMYLELPCISLAEIKVPLAGTNRQRGVRIAGRVNGALTTLAGLE